jgi:hypothetical protein
MEAPSKRQESKAIETQSHREHREKQTTDQMEKQTTDQTEKQKI